MGLTIVATLGEASNALINFGWAISFVLSAALLLAIRWLVPGAKGLAVGADGLWSTSKFQVLMWTYAIVFALFALLFAFIIVQVCGDLFNWMWARRLETPLGSRFTEFLESGLHESYAYLLGIPVLTAVGAKAITTVKVESGSVVKEGEQPDVEEVQTGEKPKKKAKKALAEITSDDAGKSDLGDYQYLLFNLLALSYFLAQFLSNPAGGLPDIPDTLLVLTGVAAAGYVGKKGIYREPPVLLSALPPRAAPGDTVRLYGENMLRAPAGGTGADPAAGDDATSLPPIVTLGGVAVEIDTATPPTSDLISVIVPLDAEPGPAKFRVIRPPGAKSEDVPFTVLDPAPVLKAVRPSRASLGVDTELAIDGVDFFAGGNSATERNGVTLGGVELEVQGEWSSNRVVAKLPESVEAASREGLEPGSISLVVYDSAGNASKEQSVELLAPT